jgi:DNA mismatch repair protein MutS
MTFSILSVGQQANYAQEMPAFFIDLNLDQIVAAAIAGKEEYDLNPFFYTPLTSVDGITYRHEIFQDLEDSSLLERIRTFARTMHDMREQLIKVGKLRHQHQQEAWFLHATEFYCDAVRRFQSDLSEFELKSRGFLALREYLTNYATGLSFVSLEQETNDLKARLSEVRYSILIKGDIVNVRNYESEPDYSVEVEETFEKFKQSAVKDYLAKFRLSPDMNHIEEKILDFVALLNPKLFSDLAEYCVRHAGFLDKTITMFDREIQFYLSYIGHIEKLKGAGLRFCYPGVSGKSKQLHNDEGFDLALAEKLIATKTPIICNDFFLKGAERIIVVTGPNQGGKTTFARTFGQLHYLASIGCPVPGRDAQFFLFDQIFTHFEKEEKVETLRGTLEDDLIRIRSILDQATSHSVIIMNEIFTSTTLQDEAFLSRKVMDKVIELDALCVWVTFVDELAWVSEQTVSMASMVDFTNPALRTFKVVRRPADGLAYALAIAEKYRITHDQIAERIPS